MRRCKCLRFKDLQYLNKGNRLWIFNDKLGLIPAEAEYPLLEFDCGNPVMICPYFLYITDEVRISEGLLHYYDITNEEKKLIDDAVKNCKETIPLTDIKYIEDRHANILEIYAERRAVDIDELLFDRFYDFLKQRRNYLDISPCLMIPPIEHSDRMECINQAWLDAFTEYLKEIT